jgi:hypothetical protein
VATAAVRRTATAILAGLVLVPSALLLTAPAYAEDPVAPADASVGEAAYEEATPDPVTGLYPGQAAPATESSPATGGWITGGTLQEGTQAKPAAKPAAKPVAKPAAKPAVAQVAEPVSAPAGPVARRRVARTTVETQPAPVRGTSTGAVAGEPTVLPFTGPGRLELQLGLSCVLLVAGGVLTAAARPRT